MFHWNQGAKSSSPTLSRRQRGFSFSIKNQKSKIKNRQSAFTLIEILLAIGILALGCTAVLFLFTMGVRSHRRAVNRTRAALLADAILSQVKADLATTLPGRYNEDPDTKEIDPITNATHADFPAFTYDLTFIKLYPKGEFYIVKAIIRWGDKNIPINERNSETYETVLRRKSF